MGDGPQSRERFATPLRPPAGCDGGRPRWSTIRAGTDHEAHEDLPWWSFLLIGPVEELGGCGVALSMLEHQFGPR